MASVGPDYVFVWDEPVYKEFTESPNGAIGQDFKKRGEELRILAQRQVGHKTGALAASIKAYVLATNEGLLLMVGSDHRTALMEHEGTRPHTEHAERGRMLRFSNRGRIVYARVVHHPGTRPNRYLSDNLRRIVN